jgi:anti-anti-sigma factor
MTEPLSLAVDVIEGVAVLRLRGGFVYGQDFDPVRSAARRLRSEGHERLIMDLSGVESTDSTGVSALLEIRHIIGERLGSVILLGPSKRLRATLAMTHVASLFEVVEDEADLRRRLGGQ